MGYTHYWDRDVRRVGTAKQFGGLALDTKAIIKKAKEDGIIICGAFGKGKPTFNEGYFALNGDADFSLDHETFIWQALPIQKKWVFEQYPQDTERLNRIFEFCKTAYKPYDAVVTAILIRAKHYYGADVDIRSDGDWSDWQAGRDLYAQVFGDEARCPFEVATV